MKVKIHIGCHKCGTSAVQEYFFSRSERLRSVGVLYPTSHAFQAAHHCLAWSLRLDSGETVPHARRLLEGKDLTAADIIEEWIADAQVVGADTLLMSSEEFEFLGDRAVAMLAAQLKDYETSLYLYVRPQDEYLVAEYKQSVMMPQTAFTGTVDEFYYRFALNSRLNYLHLASRWANVFGAENLQVAMFQRGDGDKWDVVEDLIDFAGLPSSIWEGPSAPVNVSPADLTVSAIAKLNRHGINPKLRQYIRTRLDRIVEDRGLHFHCLGGDSRQALMQCYQDANRMLIRKFGVRGDAERLLDSSSALGAADSSSAVMIDALVELIAKLGAD